MRRALSAIALSLAAATPTAADGLSFFTVGAGPLGGGYYTAARAICDVVHAQFPGRMRCSPDPTPGSVYNVVALAEGQIDFALVQSDAHHFAVTGTGPFAATGPDTNLRSVLALYPEPLTLLARRAAGIGAVPDLAGKRVKLGPRNSGSRASSTSSSARRAAAASRWRSGSSPTTSRTSTAGSMPATTPSTRRAPRSPRSSATSRPASSTTSS